MIKKKTYQFEWRKIFHLDTFLDKIDQKERQFLLPDQQVQHFPKISKYF
jgi:hypothetical protein